MNIHALEPIVMVLMGIMYQPKLYLLMI